MPCIDRDIAGLAAGAPHVGEHGFVIPVTISDARGAGRPGPIVKGSRTPQCGRFLGALEVSPHGAHGDEAGLPGWNHLAQQGSFSSMECLVVGLVNGLGIQLLGNVGAHTGLLNPLEILGRWSVGQAIQHMAATLQVPHGQTGQTQDGEDDRQCTAV